MNKNFDRNIEQLMNENEVTPPFGMWNRIAAELDASATAPAAASQTSPLPQRSFTGLIAGTLIIGVSLIAAYLINSATTIPKTEAVVVATPAPSVIVKTAPVIAEQNLQIETKTKRTAPITKSAPTKKLTAKVLKANSNPTVTLPAHTEIFIPTAHISTVNPITDKYFFPAIDMARAEVKQADKPVEEVAEVSAKTKVIKTDDDDERETLVNRDAPRIKFRPKKHRNFTYGKIIRRK